jgi:hypothetical protein
MADAAEVLKSALSLTADERAAVAEKLLASLDDLNEEEADRLWAEEAARRRQELRAGHGRAVDAADVAKKAERIFR